MVGRTKNASGIRRRDERSWPIGCGEEPPLASHLVTPRLFYTHHGIYVGGGRVIHYAGLACGLRRGPVEETSLERFAHGQGIQVQSDWRCFSRCEVVERARSRLGENRYRVLTNNCEHFCAWALRDERRSMQVERLRAKLLPLWRVIFIRHERIADTIVQLFEPFASSVMTWHARARGIGPPDAFVIRRRTQSSD
jgi:hypothetical protein